MNLSSEAGPLQDLIAPRTRAPAGADHGFTISELAELTGATIRALRYYEEAQILAPDRTGGNARRYGPEARRRAQIVVALRNLDVSLDAIRGAITPDGGLDDRRLASIFKSCRHDTQARLRAIDKLESSLNSRGLMRSEGPSGS